MCLGVISFRHVSLIEVCGLKSHASRSFFLVFVVTCVKLLRGGGHGPPTYASVHIKNAFMSQLEKNN